MFNVSQTARRGTNVCFPWLLFNACTTDLGLATGGKDSWEGRSHRREGRLLRNLEWHKAGGESVAWLPLLHSPGMVVGRAGQDPLHFFSLADQGTSKDKAWAQGHQEASEETNGECVCKGHTPVTRGS